MDDFNTCHIPRRDLLIGSIWLWSGHQIAFRAVKAVDCNNIVAVTA